MAEEGLYLAIDLGGTNLKVGAVNQTGRVLDHLSLETGAARGPAHVLEQLKKGARQMIEKMGSGASFLALGIGAPGSVDAEGVVKYPPNFPNWDEVPVKSEIAAAVGLPTFVDNDANVAAIGEATFGAARGHSDFLCVTLGTGVGGGLYLCGHIYRGAGWAAGEIGHTTVDPDGPRCNCGNTGCLESYVGAHYLVARARSRLECAPHSRLFECNEANPKSLTPETVTRAAREGDAVARAVLAETGQYLGIALASVLNLLNLPLIIFSGGVAQAGELIFDPMKVTIEERALAVPKSAYEVVPAGLGLHAGIIGAAALAMTETAAQTSG